ncbi:MAG: HEAT repeat domain-containing protein [Planctomycetes bacterium]|nr:HEAT repeat domain-containing protein [Planctomycetota bacterium]
MIPHALAAALLLGLAAAAQDTRPADLREEVQRANEHRRLQIRLAAAARLSQAGDAAVPAIHEYQQAKGGDAITLGLVEAMARSEPKGEATLGLLAGWAREPAFFWRAQALAGLAAARRDEYRALFTAALRDPAHLFRLHGARGLWLLRRPSDREPVLALLRDEDPRLRVQLAAFLLDEGELSGVPLLLGALADTREFLGDPWGRREAGIAFQALRRFAGQDFGYVAGREPAANAAAIEAFRAFARARLGDAVPADLPPAPRDPVTAGGIEIRSCRHGDWFLRWNDLGELFVGLESRRGVPMDVGAWRALEERRGKLTGAAEQLHGTVVCDYLRVHAAAPALHRRCAPGHLPGDLAAWLDELAAALATQGEDALAQGLRTRLTQFR